MGGEEEGLPLGAQQPNAKEGGSFDDDEARHFQDVCRSYQQYATFHHAKQRGVDGRLHRLLLVSGAASSAGDGGNTFEAGTIEPTVESILPPSMNPNSPESRARHKQLLDATIQNQVSVVDYACLFCTLI